MELVDSQFVHFFFPNSGISWMNHATACNKTNPTYTFFLTITILSLLNWSFWLPYCFPLLSHDLNSCQHRSYSCDINSITLYFYSHTTTNSLLLYSFYSHSTTYSLLLFPLHDQLSTSIPTPQPTLYFSIHYILTPWHTLYILLQLMLSWALYTFMTHYTYQSCISHLYN